jgi:hypothetical protein
VGLFTKLLGKKLYGSYGETAKTIANTYRIISANGQVIQSNDDIKDIFISIANSRYLSAIQTGFTQGNHLKDFEWSMSYTSFLLTSPEDEEKIHFNLPTFSFILMYQESIHKREELRDGKILTDVLEVIYKETNKMFSGQTLVSLQEYTENIIRVFGVLNSSSKILDQMEQFFL